MHCCKKNTERNLNMAEIDLSIVQERINKKLYGYNIIIIGDFYVNTFDED